MSRKADDPIALQVRMTEGLRHKLAKAAERNGRSLNAEIVWRLGQTFPQERPTPTLRLDTLMAPRAHVAAALASPADPTSSALRAIADALSADELHAKPAARVYADAPDPAPPAPREEIFEQVKAAFATPREEIFEQVKAALEQILTDNEMRERVLRMKQEGDE